VSFGVDLRASGAAIGAAKACLVGGVRRGPDAEPAVHDGVTDARERSDRALPVDEPPDLLVARSRAAAFVGERADTSPHLGDREPGLVERGERPDEQPRKSGGRVRHSASVAARA